MNHVDPSVRTVAEAPGKVILVGEHAVVYGRPAIAVPVWDTVARASISPGESGDGCVVVWAKDIGQRLNLSQAAENDPLALVTRQALARLGLTDQMDWLIELTSDIPIASGLGSGAALSAALVRAIYAHCGVDVDAHTVSELVYVSEELYHGTPSGIDNTVVAFGQPVWYVKGQTPEVFQPGAPLMLAIADSGIPGSTKETVAQVRQRRQVAQAEYEGYFDAIGDLVLATRLAMEQGRTSDIGPLFDENHTLLVRIGVSIPELDRLIQAARSAGAGGAKLSGGGGGGNIIALVDATTASSVEAALIGAGARRVIVTTVG